MRFELMSYIAQSPWLCEKLAPCNFAAIISCSYRSTIGFVWAPWRFKTLQLVQTNNKKQCSSWLLALCCKGGPPMTDGILLQKAIDAKCVSILWYEVSMLFLCFKYCYLFSKYPCKFVIHGRSRASFCWPIICSAYWISPYTTSNS